MKKIILMLGTVLFALLVFRPSPGALVSAQGLKLQATPHGTVLSWYDIDAGPTIGYNVYKGSTPGGESATALNGSTLLDLGQACSTSAGTQCSYTDSAVTPGAQGCYVVKASNGTLTSAASNEVCVTTPLAAPTLGVPTVQ
jgi:hypothetical protein